MRKEWKWITKKKWAKNEDENRLLHLKHHRLHVLVHCWILYRVLGVAVLCALASVKLIQVESLWRQQSQQFCEVSLFYRKKKNPKRNKEFDLKIWSRKLEPQKKARFWISKPPDLKKSPPTTFLFVLQLRFDSWYAAASGAAHASDKHLFLMSCFSFRSLTTFSTSPKSAEDLFFSPWFQKISVCSSFYQFRGGKNVADTFVHP